MRKDTAYLVKELQDYEKNTPMTAEERAILHSWVRRGHSVHENDAMACYEGGMPLDFLDVYREEKEISQALSSMSYEEGSRYLLKEHAIDRDDKMTSPEQTLEKLKKKANRLYRTCMLYWDVLAANGLREEARTYVKEHIDEELPFDSFEWDIEQ